MSDQDFNITPDNKGAHILITSASRKVPLIRAMKKAAVRISPEVQVVAGDSDPNVAARYAADAFWQMPRLDEISQTAMVESCLERNIGTVLPTRDGELPFWSRAREEFARAGIDIVVSSPESVDRCLDKLDFARFGAEQELPIIPTATDPGVLEAASFVVKDRFGSGSREIGLNLDQESALAHAEYLESPVFQPFVSGPEISVDAWMDASCTPRGLVLRRRDQVKEGESWITTTFRDPALEDTAMRVLRALKLRGPAVLQAIIAEAGRLDVIECNPRFGGASTASVAAGLDMLYWSLAEHRTPSAPQRFGRIEGELRLVRVPEDIILYDPDL